MITEVSNIFSSSSTWTLEHPWDFHPAVFVTDNLGNDVLCAPDYSVDGQVTVHWDSASSGSMLLKGGVALEFEITNENPWTREHEWVSDPLVVVVDDDGNAIWCEPDFSVSGEVTVYWDSPSSGVFTLISADPVDEELPPVAPLIDRGWRLELFESNLFNKDEHPVTGLPTPGIHTRVRRLKHASSPSYSPVLNRPASVRFQLPLDSPEALDVVGHEIKRCVILFVDAPDPDDPPVALWSGYVSAVALSTSSASVDVTCTGWFQMLYSREFRFPCDFVEMDPGEIALRILGTANHQIVNGNTIYPDFLMENLFLEAGELQNELAISPALDLDYIDTSYAPVDLPPFVSDWDYSSDVLPAGAKGMYLGASEPLSSSVYLEGMKGAASAGPFPGSPLRLRVVYYKKDWNAGDQLEIKFSIFNGIFFFYRYVYITDADPTTGVKNVDVDFGFGGLFSTILKVIPSGSGDHTGIVLNSMALTSPHPYEGVGEVPTPILPGEVSSPSGPVTRTRKYEIGDKIGRAIEELSDIEGGYDFDVRTVREVISGGVTYNRRLDIKWEQVKEGTTIYGIGEDKQDVIFKYRLGNKSNMTAIGETREAGNMGNRINGRSAGNLAIAQDTDSAHSIGLWEDSVNVSDSVSNDVLLAYAGAEVSFRKDPTRRFSPTPRPYDGSDATPVSFRDYNVGDIVYVEAERGALQIGTEELQPVRIFGFTVTIDNEGNESLSEFQTTMGN